MLIVSSFSRNPSNNSTKNGVVVMGGVVSQYASSLAQLGYVKFCGHAFYYVSRYTPRPTSSDPYSQVRTSHATLNKGTQDYEFLIATLPMSTHLAIVVRYAASNHTAGGTNSPIIDLSLKDGVSTIDAGIRFEYPLHLSQQGNRGRSKVFEANTGVIIETPSGGSYVSITIPRPLFIPPSNRGNVLNIIGQVTDCNILAIDVFEVYQETRIP